jgi:hypothetical protein
MREPWPEKWKKRLSPGRASDTSQWHARMITSLQAGTGARAHGHAAGRQQVWCQVGGAGSKAGLARSAAAPLSRAWPRPHATRRV